MAAVNGEILFVLRGVGNWRQLGIWVDMGFGFVKDYHELASKTASGANYAF